MRFTFHHILRIVLLAAILATSAFPLSAVTIVSVASNGSQTGPALSSQQFLMVNWTSTVGFSNVTISAFVNSGSAAHTAATAYLATQVGPSATSATLVAQSNLTLPTGNNPPELQLFSGLSLPAGTYYLVVATTDSSSTEEWLAGVLPAMAVTAPGVTDNGPPSAGSTANAGYPPATNFDVGLSEGMAFDVTGLPLSGGEATTLFIPQIVDGGAWQTTIGVTNTNTTPANAALLFYQATDAAGDTAPWTLPLVDAVDTSNIELAPGATVFLQTPDRTATLTEGYGELIADRGVQALAIFTLYVPGRQNQDGTALAAATGSHILLPVDNSPGFTTSIAIANASQGAETLSAKLLLDTGETVSSSLPSIPGLGHAAFTLTTQFPQSVGHRGTLELSSELELAASTPGHAPAVIDLLPAFSVIGLRFNPTGAFTSLPVYVVAAAPF